MDNDFEDKRRDKALHTKHDINANSNDDEEEDAGTVMPDQEINNSNDENIQENRSGLGCFGFGSGYGTNETDKVEADDDDKDSLLPRVNGKQIKEGAQKRDNERERQQSSCGGFWGVWEAR